MDRGIWVPGTWMRCSPDPTHLFPHRCCVVILWPTIRSPFERLGNSLPSPMIDSCLTSERYQVQWEFDEAMAVPQRRLATPSFIVQVQVEESSSKVRYGRCTWKLKLVLFVLWLRGSLSCCGSLHRVPESPVTHTPYPIRTFHYLTLP